MSFACNFKKRTQQRGQIVVEYILLLVIAVGIAALLVSQLVGRGDDPGVIVAKWQSIMKAVGADNPDKRKQ